MTFELVRKKGILEPNILPGCGHDIDDFIEASMKLFLASRHAIQVYCTKRNPATAGKNVRVRQFKVDLCDNQLHIKCNG